MGKRQNSPTKKAAMDSTVNHHNAISYLHLEKSTVTYALG